MNYRTLKYLPLATAASTVIPLLAKAQSVDTGAGGNVAGLTPAPTAEGVKIGELITSVITIIVWVATVVAIIYLILSGFNYITAGGDQEKADAARKGIINAVIGIIVILAAFYILEIARSFGTGITTGDITGQL